jgi:flavin-dependent dehydrogenase
MSQQNQFDLIVIGGGSAGMAAAIRVALCGLKVIVFDAAGEFYDKPCGEGLMPPAIDCLEKLGVRVAKKFDFQGIRSFGYDGQSSLVAFPGRAKGFGIRRRELRGAMWSRARELQVEIRTESIKSIEERGELVHVGAVSAPWLCLASGSRSALTRSLAPMSARANFARFGLRRHAQMVPWSDCVEVYWAREAELYVTPVADDTVNFAVLSWSPMSFEQALKLFPAVEQKLKGVHWVDESRGVGPLMRRAAWFQRGRVLLAGDAAGFLDAMTGEGNALALAAGIAAADAVVSGRVTSYPGIWRQLTWRYWALTWSLLWLTRPGGLRFWIVRLVTRHAVIFRLGLRFMLGPQSLRAIRR